MQRAPLQRASLASGDSKKRLPEHHTRVASGRVELCAFVRSPNAPQQQLPKDRRPMHRPPESASMAHTHDIPKSYRRPAFVPCKQSSADLSRPRRPTLPFLARARGQRKPTPPRNRCRPDFVCDIIVASVSSLVGKVARTQFGPRSPALPYPTRTRGRRSPVNAHQHLFDTDGR